MVCLHRSCSGYFPSCFPLESENEGLAQNHRYTNNGSRVFVCYMIIFLSLLLKLFFHSAMIAAIAKTLQLPKQNSPDATYEIFWLYITFTSVLLSFFIIMTRSRAKIPLLVSRRILWSWLRVHPHSPSCGRVCSAKDTTKPHQGSTLPLDHLGMVIEDKSAKMKWSVFTTHRILFSLM